MGHGKGNNQIKFLDETDHRIEKSFIILLERRYREYASKFQTKILILSTKSEINSYHLPHSDLFRKDKKCHQLSRPQPPSLAN